MPSLSAMFSYLLRFRRVPQNKRGDYDTDDTYELLPKAGFVSLEKIPWTRVQLVWAICNEVKGILPFKARAFAERVIPDPPIPDGELPEGRMQKLDPVLFEKLLNKSEYYRLEMVVLMRLGWNKKLGEIRALESEKLKICTDHLKKTPWELCFYKHSHEYDLGELSLTGFTAIVEHLQIQVTPVIYAAVRLYDFIKGQKIRHGHTLFNEEQTLAQFKQHQSTPQHVASVAKAAQMWLARNDYLVFINEQGQTVRDQAKWFPQEGEPKIKGKHLGAGSVFIHSLGGAAHAYLSSRYAIAFGRTDQDANHGSLASDSRQFPGWKRQLYPASSGRRRSRLFSAQGSAEYQAKDGG
jgi:hypothetical protein